MTALPGCAYEGSLPETWVILYVYVLPEVFPQTSCFRYMCFGASVPATPTGEFYSNALKTHGICHRIHFFLLLASYKTMERDTGTT